MCGRKLIRATSESCISLTEEGRASVTGIGCSGSAQQKKSNESVWVRSVRSLSEALALMLRTSSSRFDGRSLGALSQGARRGGAPCLHHYGSQRLDQPAITPLTQRMGRYAARVFAWVSP